MVKLPLPKKIQYPTFNSSWKRTIENSPNLGKNLRRGYPYGYITLGIEQPTAITLTRFLAANKIKERRLNVILMDLELQECQAVQYL